MMVGERLPGCGIMCGINTSTFVCVGSTVTRTTAVGCSGAAVWAKAVHGLGVITVMGGLAAQREVLERAGPLRLFGP